MSINQFVNKVINGDASVELKKLPDKSIDLVVTSPPYDDLRDYKNSQVWNMKTFVIIAEELQRTLKDGGVIVWVVGDKVEKSNKTLSSFKQAIYFQELGLNIYDVLIYEKE